MGGKTNEKFLYILLLPIYLRETKYELATGRNLVILKKYNIFLIKLSKTGNNDNKHKI